MEPSAAKPLIRALRKALRDLADPAKAPIMQAYMKSEMPYWGVQTPELRRTAKAAFAAHPLETPTYVVVVGEPGSGGGAPRVHFDRYLA